MRSDVYSCGESWITSTVSVLNWRTGSAGSSKNRNTGTSTICVRSEMRSLGMISTPREFPPRLALVLRVYARHCHRLRHLSLSGMCLSIHLEMCVRPMLGDPDVSARELTATTGDSYLERSSSLENIPTSSWVLRECRVAWQRLHPLHLERSGSLWRPYSAKLVCRCRGWSEQSVALVVSATCHGMSWSSRLSSEPWLITG